MPGGRPRTVSTDEILTGAARVIGRAGPARMTLADVGREVGLSAPTLAQRFGSKRGLLLALARHDAEAVPRRLSAARSAPSPVDALIDGFVALAGTVRDEAEFANHLAFLLLDLADPEFRRIARDYATAIEAAVAEVLAAAELPGADLDSLPAAVHAAYNGAMVTWGMRGGGSAAEAVRAQLTTLFSPYRGPAPR
jgi:AcrR family transcriptional regulator